MSTREYLHQAVVAAVRAGSEMMDVYQKDFLVDYKEDESPLTEADKKSDEIIQAVLRGTFPIISEESKAVPFDERLSWTTCWLVDPLDGTKEFIKKNGEFTVNIALIREGIPVLGVVYLPVLRTLYFGSEEMDSRVVRELQWEEGQGFDLLLQESVEIANGLLPDVFTIVASRSHMSAETEEFVEDAKARYGAVHLVSKGSSIKICLVAERKAHVYPRLAPTMEWDTAAAHAVAKYAGCEVVDFYTKAELTYNKEELLNPHFIVRRREKDLQR